MQPLIHPQHVQRDFLKYTAQKIKFDLQKNNPELFEEFRSDANDSTFQFWKRRALSIELRTDNVYQQKLEYIHWNPVKAALCKLPEEYKYSSAQFYHTGIDNLPAGRQVGDFLHITGIKKKTSGWWKKTPTTA